MPAHPDKDGIAEGLDGAYDLISALAPGGQALIGNFGPANPDRPLMELILDWPLLHRTAGDLTRLFGDFGTGVTIEKEATGVNLFAVIRR